MIKQNFRVLHPGIAKALDSIWIIPFFLFCLIFEIIPIIILVKDSFFDSAGLFTLANYAGLKNLFICFPSGTVLGFLR
ncbi:MAG: hypothetical protein J7K04_14575 [Spirochaetales bacterium]|nr:hypothetical protein [Spirochaetales bacterium]